jgi:LacI family transcriptional regulator
MAEEKRRKRSPRFVEIAAAAGVSVATVDRVLNQRGSVSEAARAGVIAAARRLGVPRILPSPSHALVHFDVLLPDSPTPFFRRLRSAFADSGSFFDKRFVVHRRIIREDREDLLVQAIAAPDYPRRGLAVAAPDTPAVRAALGLALGRGEAIAAVVSPVAGAGELAYVGIDNYRAGRTAGLILGRFARKPGRVMFLSGHNDWNAHLARTAGCREALDGAFPLLRCDPAQMETQDDEARCYEAVADALRTTGLAGLYNSGAGSDGIVRALERFDPGREVVWVTHELSDDHRQYLRSGVLDMVIDQDPDMQAISALRYLVQMVEASHVRPSSEGWSCEFRLYFAENLSEGIYFAPSPEGRRRP